MDSQVYMCIYTTRAGPIRVMRVWRGAGGRPVGGAVRTGWGWSWNTRSGGAVGSVVSRLLFADAAGMGGRGQPPHSVSPPAPAIDVAARLDTVHS